MAFDFKEILTVIIQTQPWLQHRIQRPGGGGGEGAKKHEIYVATFGGHLFMTYLYRAGGGGAWPPLHPPDQLLG